MVSHFPFFLVRRISRDRTVADDSFATLSLQDPTPSIICLSVLAASALGVCSRDGVEIVTSFRFHLFSSLPLSSLFSLPVVLFVPWLAVQCSSLSSIF